MRSSRFPTGEATCAVGEALPLALRKRKAQALPMRSVCLRRSRSTPTNLAESIYLLFVDRLKAGWLVDCDGAEIIDLADRMLVELTISKPNFISIATIDKLEFIALFMAGCRSGLPIFLGNPQWGSIELAQVTDLTARIVGVASPVGNREFHQNLVMIPTGGSSGKIKFVAHSWETLSASVWGFQEFYEVSEINSVCTLPLYHVSGLMQLMRSLLTGGNLSIVDFHQLCEHPPSDIPSNCFISLVPTQLEKLLALHPLWLLQFKTILLGGAPPSLELLKLARSRQLPLALTYGMTETSSQIASLKPAEFLAGNNSCGRVLPHAHIDLISTGDDGIGSIRIQAKSLMLGYFPDLEQPEYFEPDDLGSIDERGYLTIIGRSSDKIISGGENVYPIEVVNAIIATGLVEDVWVIGVPDRYWGQIVTAIYVPKDLDLAVDVLKRSIVGKISKYKLPKSWIQVDKIPRNALGKVLEIKSTGDR
jgi:o-succinylbenzoate---CoA ligase